MKKLLIVATGFVFLLVSCSTLISSRWKSKSAKAEKYNKILVIGIVSNADSALRGKMEKHLVGDLKDIGYTAISSYEELGPQLPKSANEKSMLDKLQTKGVDAVLTVVLLDKKKERYYVPGKVQYTPYSTSNNHFPNYYNTLTTRVFSEGYYEDQTKYFWESNFYSGENEELLYSVQTTSFQSGSLESLAHQYGRTIILDMVKHEIFSKPDESQLYQKGF